MKTLVNPPLDSWSTRGNRLLAVLVYLGLGSFGLFPGMGVAQNVNITLATKLTYHMDGRIGVSDPGHQFDCNQRIYAVAQVSGLAAGDQSLAIQWFGPSGELEYEQDFEFSSNDNATSGLGQAMAEKPLYLSSYIEFHSQGFLASLFEPGAGLESYIGDWDVRVSANGTDAGSTQFSLMC